MNNDPKLIPDVPGCTDAPIAFDCALCQDHGTFFGHKDDCESDTCTIVGDESECDGQMHFCDCKAGDRKRAEADDIDHTDDNGYGVEIEYVDDDIVTCCADEQRDMSGGCINCGDPCL